MSKHFFEADSIVKTYQNNCILNGVYLKLNSSEIVGVFGRNGCGKSTLLKILFGIEKADFSFFRFNGAVLKKPYKHKDVVGYLPQEGFLLENIKIEKIIKIYLEKRVDIPEEIKKHYGCKVSDLSYGNRKFLEVFILMQLDHRFVFFDEPFSGLSPIYIQLISSYIVENRRNKGVLLVDHNYESILKISDKNYVLESGVLKPVVCMGDLTKFGYINN